jgi:Na+/H+ antiporter NhaD/arsenite permease-like protein
VGFLSVFFYRRVLLKVDWLLLLLFLLMFIDLHLAAQTPLVRNELAGLGLADARNLYLAGLASSQLLGNAPAAMLLSKFSPNWAVLAYAVNVGGAGLAIGSLANIIALRMADAPGVWLRFHKYSIPFLLATALAVWLIL